MDGFAVRDVLWYQEINHGKIHDIYRETWLGGASFLAVCNVFEAVVCDPFSYSIPGTKVADSPWTRPWAYSWSTMESTKHILRCNPWKHRRAPWNVPRHSPCVHGVCHGDPFHYIYETNRLVHGAPWSMPLSLRGLFHGARRCPRGPFVHGSTFKKTMAAIDWQIQHGVDCRLLSAPLTSWQRTQDTRGHQQLTASPSSPPRSAFRRARSLTPNSLLWICRFSSDKREQQTASRPIVFRAIQIPARIPAGT